MKQTGLEESGAQTEADAKRPKSILTERPERNEDTSAATDERMRISALGAGGHTDNWRITASSQPSVRKR